MKKFSLLNEKAEINRKIIFLLCYQTINPIHIAVILCIPSPYVNIFTTFKTQNNIRANHTQHNNNKNHDKIFK